MMDQVDHIMQVMEAAFDPQWGEAWNRKQVSDALILPHTHAILADCHGTLFEVSEAPAAGFVLSRHAADEEELLLIAVDPAHRGRGIATGLIEALFRNAATRGVTRVFLEMRSNNPAETLYRRSGFVPIGQRKDYYKLSSGDRLDAITFARTLDIHT
ncbi:GNAT family N-acetyltransferase [Altererythrobacter sp. GH1-8]|uniref:GNAT family N-acetyltransferase n=1 Tax=Altererythrobacter sp. GH1-8 TaxID=3349333 RepID=UPI00374CD0B8